jgi:photosystem II stability/assembly factor-like uncharacterized protein
MSGTLWIGTRKGAFALRSDARRKAWKLAGPQFLGHIIHHVVQDPRQPKVLLMAAKTGHLGPTVFRSTDRGRTWREASQPPAFRKVNGGQGATQAPRDAEPSSSSDGERATGAQQEARAVQRVFWLTPGHASESGTWYAGSSPAGLFRSKDGGDRWEPVAGFNDHPMRPKWAAFGTPDGEFLHSILVDPRDPNHLYVGISVGGVFESTDGGRDWTPMNEGCAADFMPDPTVPYGHDPHCVAQHPLAPDRLYQQNHCGIYRLDRPERRWTRIGAAMPKKIGDIGFPIVLHPRDPDTAWVFPMDGQTVWPRTAIAGQPAVYVTRTAGKRWQRLDKGLPDSQAWLTVLRQAMCADAHPRTGLYFGTTGGEVWASANEGESWSCIARHLPEIYSVTWAD